MANALVRSFQIVEYLAARPEGIPMASIADDLGIPRSACHRVLVELIECGYVRQMREHGDYALTTKLAALGLNYLSSSGIIDIAQPIIDRMATISGELVRLAIVDGERLTFVAKMQGAKSGLRYDPDTGTDVRLSCSAAGHAWLSTLPEERAMEIVLHQGFGSAEQFGPKAPTTMAQLSRIFKETRKRGFSMINEMFAPGMSAMAAPVQREGEAAIGVITIAGPNVRLTEARMLELGAPLLAMTAELAMASRASPIFVRSGTRSGAGGTKAALA
jgi:IclR family acetate operon transcriptional repressor